MFLREAQQAQQAGDHVKARAAALMVRVALDL